MAIIRGDNATGDLLSWEPPRPRQSFAEEQIRAVSLSARFAKAISLALKECPLDRAEIAARMSDYLGVNVSEAMLNAYASEARTDHNISLHRFAALVHATGDWRLLSTLVDLFPVAIVDRKYLDVIHLAQISEKKRELEAAENQLRRAAKSEGLI